MNIRSISRASMAALLALSAWAGNPTAKQKSTQATSKNKPALNINTRSVNPASPKNYNIHMGVAPQQTPSTGMAASNQKNGPKAWGNTTGASAKKQQGPKGGKNP
jgi:hypothetical protein